LRGGRPGWVVISFVLFVVGFFFRILERGFGASSLRAARWNWERGAGGSGPETETFLVWVLLWGESSLGVGEERVRLSFFLVFHSSFFVGWVFLGSK
jgi:hypothetical protein